MKHKFQTYGSITNVISYYLSISYKRYLNSLKLWRIWDRFFLLFGLKTKSVRISIARYKIYKKNFNIAKRWLDDKIQGDKRAWWNRIEKEFEEAEKIKSRYMDVICNKDK